MASRKRKTLPKDFADTLEAGDIDAIIAVFDQCDVNAVGGYSKATALANPKCPEAVVRWLVDNGADVNAGDSYQRTPLHSLAASWAGDLELLLELGAELEATDYEGRTPLHAAAQRHVPRSVRILVDKGAAVNAADTRGATPLELALATASNIDVERTAELSEILIAAGATITEACRANVQRLGNDVEFYRDRIVSDMIVATEVGLERLYGTFDVPPVPRLVRHDGTSAIVIPDGSAGDRFRTLWNFLVPPSSTAPTVQGEVVRISGRLAHEILGNGAANWDAQFRALVDALPGYLSSGTPLGSAELGSLEPVLATVRKGAGTEVELHEVRDAAVAWVELNPLPIPLNSVPYQR